MLINATDRFSLKLERWSSGEVESGWWEETLIRFDYTLQTMKTGPLNVKKNLGA